MAALENMYDSQLSLEYDHGMNLDGKIMTKVKNYNNLKTTATPEGILAVAQAISSLQQHPLNYIKRNSNYEIFNG
ncbi:DUF1659 domain-containing protein [Bacillus sp. Marseille-P3661]|uniref:DUF1659 domain-containing protein n=1 Tax=Bacillus sp. Marseille-P3661 TaxID=1936234 RepID=UPI000C8177A8|nr:DUF1659 domain-containing protein [Bacillus sp. Marseille-P3661]